VIRRLERAGRLGYRAKGVLSSGRGAEAAVVSPYSRPIIIWQKRRIVTRNAPQLAGRGGHPTGGGPLEHSGRRA